MLRYLLSAFSIFVLLFTTAFLPRSAAARRCGFREPLTLLTLYRTSDAIYVGRYDKVEEGEVTEETPEYRVVPIVKHFSISSALKGETKKMLTLEDSEYRYKNQETSSEDPVEHAEEVEPDEDAAPELQPGDSVMLFVSRGDEGEVVLTDYSDGIKKMTPDKLAAYESRIRELNGIFNAKRPSYAHLIDWLVRCAEDPETRWEGSYELLRSFQMLDFAESNAKLTTEAPEGEATTADEEEVSHGAKKFDTGDPEFARNVTDAHKNALTRILLAGDMPKKSARGEQPVTAVNGDSDLLTLVKRWGDSSVAIGLVERLRRSSGDPSLTAELMDSIATMLNDEELLATAEEFSDVQWESADALIEGEDSDEPETAQEEVAGEANAEQAELAKVSMVPVQTESDVEATEPADEADESEVVDEEDQSSNKTYADLRNELLQEFLARAQQVIEKEKSKKVAKEIH